MLQETPQEFLSGQGASTPVSGIRLTITKGNFTIGILENIAITDRSYAVDPKVKSG